MSTHIILAVKNVEGWLNFLLTFHYKLWANFKISDHFSRVRHQCLFHVGTCRQIVYTFWCRLITKRLRNLTTNFNIHLHSVYTFEMRPFSNLLFWLIMHQFVRRSRFRISGSFWRREKILEGFDRLIRVGLVWVGEATVITRGNRSSCWGRGQASEREQVGLQLWKCLQGGKK